MYLVEEKMEEQPCKCNIIVEEKMEKQTCKCNIIDKNCNRVQML